MSVDRGTPSDMLAAHPETAYFWGHVAADGDCADDCVTVRTTDETAARRLAAVAGADQVDRHITEREYAHDTTVTRREDEYVVQVFGELADRASAAMGLPIDGQPGGYRLDALSEYDRQLLRGLLEGCGTVCYRSDEDVIGVSFVHEDERLLETVQSVLDRIPVETAYDDLAPASAGHWFGVADDCVPELGQWCYEGSDESGLFAPSRRRKLHRSVERAAEADADRDADRNRDASTGSS